MHHTYNKVAIDDLPRIPTRLLESVTWLGEAPTAADASSILRADQSQRVLGPGVVSWLVEQGVSDELVPEVLRDLAANSRLLAGIRSPTACFVDLGDKVVPLADSAGGGWLVHFLTDSQAVLSWLIHIAGDGQHRIVVTPALIGYEVAPEPDEPYPVPDRPLTSADLAALEVEESAGTLLEFLARLWLEGEAWWTRRGEAPATPDVVAYEDAWRRLYPSS